MASSASRRRRGGGLDYWPAFVDVLSNLLLVFIFLLSVFAVVQFLLNTEIGERDTLLDQLRNQIATLNETLAMERAEEADLTATIATLTQNLATAEGERDRLAGVIATNQTAVDAAGGQVTALTTQLTDQQLLTQRALSQVEILNQQIAALRAQLASIEAALGIAEAQRTDNEAQIADLGARLNLALQERVEELSRYRSDFFGRLSEILGNRDDIQIVGDRFVFRSDVLFEVGSAALNDAGQQQLIQLAGAIRQLEAEIPADIPWVLQVNGHTDAQPMRAGGEFASNWELSTARALSVVELLQAQGVSPERLAAAGFGEYQPLEEGATADVYARNRRIELKLTE